MSCILEAAAPNMHFILILAHIYVYAAADKMHIRILATAAKNASSVFADQ